MPLWLSFNPENRTFIGNPDEYDVIYEITIVASDGYQNASDNFFIDLNSPQIEYNNDITFKLQNQINDYDPIKVGRLFNLTLKTGTFLNEDKLLFYAYESQLIENKKTRALEEQLTQNWSDLVELNKVGDKSWIKFDNFS